jgi:hypothetical protein
MNGPNFRMALPPEMRLPAPNARAPGPARTKTFDLAPLRIAVRPAPQIIAPLPTLRATPPLRVAGGRAPAASAYPSRGRESQFGESLFAPPPVGVAAQTPAPDVIPDPYVDYARRYTREGGVVITYKDVDDRLWRRILKVLVWLAAVGGTLWFAWFASPMPMASGQLGPVLFNIIGVAVMAWVYARILGKPVHVYRSVEVRPDRFIIDDAEEFYRDRFELGWPKFKGGKDGMKLVGTYRSRLVEFLTVPRFDEGDRAPDLFASHLEAAFRQLWSSPSR